jgi:TonB-linked SusC/RagA family outer membrane protein
MKRKNLILILCLFLGFTTFAQKRVTGVVYDGQGYAIPGVTVIEKGTTNGVITDLDGNFDISVAGDESTIVFSFIGMQTQERIVGTQSTFNVTMASSVSDLDEVVVVGYGVQKKKLVTGANISIGSEEMQRQNTTQALEAIQSFSPGVNITQASGMPGEGFKVNIRGMGTMGESSPLYVIDGVAGGDINHLSPADIETIDVLKDAASAAIYGSRAANGVILVTTKGGRKGRTTVTYDAFYGVQNVAKQPELLNAEQFMEIYNEEASLTPGKSPIDWATAIPGLYQQIQSGQWNGTNWMEEIENKNAPYQQHAINITGGSDQSVFALGFSYASQEGILGAPVAPHNDRYTVRMNSDHVIYENDGLDVIKVGQTFNYRFNERSGVAIGGMYYNDIRNMLTGNPLVPVRNADGEYFARADMQASGLEALSTRFYNPQALMEYNRGMNETQNYNINSNAYLQIQPVSGLIFKSSFGYRMFADAYRNYQPAYNLAGDASLTPGRINQNAGSGYSWTLENTLNYNFDLDQHSFDVLAGQSVERWGYGSNMDVTNANPTFEGFKYAYLDNTDGLTSGVTSIAGSPLEQESLASFFGRVNYDFNERYLLSLVLRADASSNFAEDLRWGYFPSVSAGWVLTEESFLAGNETLDFLKLRASWGQNGNAAIDPFQYMSLIGFNVENNYRFGNDRNKNQLGGFPAKLPNEDVSWETSEQLNLGVDAYFLRSRLQLAVDYYVKTTRDWLMPKPIAAIQGAAAPDVNAGDVENKGIELGLRWNDNLGDFSYGAHFNFVKNTNEVTRMGDNTGFIESNYNVISQGTDPVWRVEVGYPIGYFHGYKTEGVFQNQAQIDNWEHGFLQEAPAPGDLIFSDTNGDGDVTPDDKTMIGHGMPDVRIGFGINLAYLGFDFSLSGKGAFGHEILQSYRSFGDNEFHNYTTEILGRWTGEGTSNRIPRMTPGNGANRLNISDLYIEDGDFIKIQDVTIGYDFKKLFPDMPFGQARLYVAGRNLLTITDYSGQDPEVGYGDDRAFVQGIDLGFYPSPRTYLMGVNLKF